VGYDTFGLLTSSGQAAQGNSASALGAKYSGKNGGVKWLNCTVDPTSYDSNDNNVSLVAEVQHTGATLFPGQPDRAIFFLSLEQATWKINILFICASAQCGD
jgi:hypothetical protein